MILVLSHHLMVVYIWTKFHENILDVIKVAERTQFSWEKFQKGHNSVKKCRWSYRSCSLHIV